MAGTEASAVAIDSVQYQVSVNLGQRPDGQRRRLLTGGYASLLVRLLCVSMKCCADCSGHP